jgi:hypothetical protein
MKIDDRAAEAKSPSESGPISNVQSYVADLIMKEAPPRVPPNKPETTIPHALVMPAANELYTDHTLPAALSAPLSAYGAAQDGIVRQTCIATELAQLNKDLSSLTNEVTALDKQLASFEKGTTDCHHPNNGTGEPAQGLEPIPPVGGTSPEPIVPVLPHPIEPTPPGGTAPIEPIKPVLPHPIEPTPPGGTAPIEPIKPVLPHPIEPTPPGGTAPIVPAPVEPTPPPGNKSGFTISDGQLRLNGKPLSGVALESEYAQKLGPQTTADQIASSFPGINVVRLATSPEGGAFSGGKTLSAAQGAESVNDINQLIKAFNDKGIGVIVDNHGSDASTNDNVAQTGKEAAWFAQIAKDNLDNRMVMFQTENEPTSTDWRTGSNNSASDAAITDEQEAAYKAIRATGSNAIVAFEQEHGVPDEGKMFQANAATYNRDYNYVIDAHDYGNPAGDSDPAAQIKQVLSQTSMLHEADGGAVPVYFGETGNAGDGRDKDPNANKLLNGLWSSGDGAIAWIYNPTGGTVGNDADDLTVAHTIALSPYGEEILNLIEHSDP